MTRRTRFEYGDTADIIKTILEMDKTADRHINHDAAHCLQEQDGYTTLRNIWKFVKYNVTYRADTSGHEIVKSPAALFSIGKGDCKSFSIAEVALLRSLGFKGIRYRFTAYDRPDFTHVYVVVRYRGRDVILDAVHDYFDDEAPYRRKKDIPAARAGISGIGNVSTTGNGFVNLFVIGLAAYFLAK